MSQTITQLHVKIVQEWENISQNYEKRHVTSMQQCWKAVINSHGGHTEGIRMINYHWHSSFCNTDFLRIITFIGHVYCICVCYAIK